MGCFISCFRSRDKDRGFRSPISTNSNLLRESLVSKDQIDKEIKENLTDHDVLNEELRQENFLHDSLVLKDQAEDKVIEENLDNNEVLNEELRQEAEQLKLCGVIPQTPMEIKKSQKRRAFQELNGLDPSPKSSQTGSDKKISEQEKVLEMSSGKQISDSKENTPEFQSSGSKEGTKGSKLEMSSTLTPAQHVFRLTDPNTNSPYPTPLILRDEMETPFTVYMETPRTGKRARIRAQYVFPPVSKPALPGEMEISSGIKTGEVFSFCAEKRDEETPKVSVASLSEWLKPVSGRNGGVHFVKNGIPNSTTKYKEDQKVKWHATPFEERLEKVLSEEKMPPRKLLVLEE